MPFANADDLLGRPTGPMIPEDEAGMRERVSETLVPKGTFVTYRSDASKQGDLSARPNAYNTGRVKVLTPENAIRDFPQGAGVNFDAQQEAKMSYRTRGQAYKEIPYADARPVIGRPMWPAKQLFPYTPSVDQVDSTEHDIVPVSSRTSKRDSLVAPVDGDDSSRGFSPTKDLKGDLGMGRGMGEDAFVYGGPEAHSESGVNEHDLLTLVDWDDEKNDWQLGAAGKAKAANVAVMLAGRIAKAAVALAKKGQFRSTAEAVTWMEKRGDEIKTRRIKKLDSSIAVAVKEAIRIATPQIEDALARGVSDYLSHHEQNALGSFEWKGDGRGFAWRGMGSFHWDKDARSFRWLDGIKDTAAVPITSKTDKVMGVQVGKPGTRGMSGDEKHYRYADGEDTTGWTGADNDGWPYLGGLGQSDEEAVTNAQVAASQAAAADDWKAGLVTSLDTNPPAAKAVTNAATAAVASQVKTGQISTTDQILGAISSAAKIAAQVYTQQVAPKPAAPAAPATGLLAKIGISADTPFYKSPLFWGGVALLTVGVGVLTLKGGGSSKGGSRRSTTRRRYRKNAVLPFTAYSNTRRWKSRYA